MRSFAKPRLANAPSAAGSQHVPTLRKPAGRGESLRLDAGILHVPSRRSERSSSNSKDHRSVGWERIGRIGRIGPDDGCLARGGCAQSVQALFQVRDQCIRIFQPDVHAHQRRASSASELRSASSAAAASRSFPFSCFTKNLENQFICVGQDRGGARSVRHHLTA